jgi:hypothetical protein
MNLVVSGALPRDDDAQPHDRERERQFDLESRVAPAVVVAGHRGATGEEDEDRHHSPDAARGSDTALGRRPGGITGDRRLAT